MSFEPLVGRRIPQSPVLANRVCIPPGAVKHAVAKAQRLGKGVEEGVEEGVEAQQPYVEAGDGELEEAFDHGDKVEVVDGLHRVLHGWDGVLVDEDVDHDECCGELNESFEEEPCPETGDSRIRGLIAERGCPPKVVKI